MKHTERIDAPDDTLGEDLVLVQGEERAKRSWGHQWEHDAVARPVPLEHLTLHEGLACTGPKFLAHLRLRLTKGKCLRLGEEVGEQNAVVLGFCDGVVTRSWGDEIGRD